MDNAIEEKITMADLAAKMGEYVKMEEELEFPLFAAYYQDVMSCLQMDYQGLTVDELVQAQAICGIMAGNAQARNVRKDANRKKFQKMQEKSSFWQEAIKARLKKEGIDEEELAQKTEGLF
ncbi:MAG: hypothetical protein FWG43_04270 [Clostridiales bacterium]|nr:hypothetical protein [Clostridiales bacterium]